MPGLPVLSCLQVWQRDPKRARKKDLTIGYEADTEEADTDEPPIKKSKKISNVRA